MRKLQFGIVASFFLSVGWATVVGGQENYLSPYRIVYTAPKAELLAPNAQAPRDDWHLESHVPYQEWYSHKVRKEYGPWGPGPRHYPPIEQATNASPEWKRERVLAVAESYIGLPYQHHHIPDWDPPLTWPWKEVAYGRNSKGVDCSDFTSWCYNYGLGIKLDTGIRQQAEQTELAEGRVHASTIRDENGYDDLVHRLKTGDLLYIRNKQGKVGHVIMWVGSRGESPDKTPLIIDCTGLGHTDSNGNQIPIGVHLRPFGRDSWYYKSFAHAHRIIHDES